VSQFGLDLGGVPAPLSPAAVGTVEGPEQIALSPDGTSAYVTGQEADRVAQYDIDPATGALSLKSPSSVPAWEAPVAIALTPDGRSAYVASSTRDWVIEYDVDPLDGTLHEKLPSSVATGDLPRDLVVSPDGTSLYVADQGSDEISQYDIDPEDGSLSPKATPTVAAGEAPFAVAVGADGGSLYAADIGSGEVSQYDIDPEDGTLAPKAVPTVATGSEPDALAVSPGGADLYVLSQGSQDIRQYGIDPDDGSLATKSTTSVGSASLPTEIAFSPDGGSVYVSNWSAHDLLVYDVGPATGSLSPHGSVGTYSAPSGIATLADTTGPTVTIESGPTGTVVERDAEFSFTANEAGSAFECALDAASFQPCSSPQAYSGLGDGGHTFRVRAADPWQNTGPAAERTWTVDTTGPTVMIDAGTSGTVSDPDALFAFSASEAGSTFECSLGGVFSACSSPVAYVGLRDGAHVFAARATDPLGNVGVPTRRRWSIKTAMADPGRSPLPTPRPRDAPSARVQPSPPWLVLGRLRRDGRKGTARLTVLVSGPGEVRLAGTRTVTEVRRRAAGRGRIRLPVVPRRKAQQNLRKDGRLKVSLRVVYRPKGAVPLTESRRVTLTKRARHG
jgi:DNA-binding beta-propeller fold protein YncE